MRHVWILDHYAHRPAEGGLTRHHALASYLPSNGWQASIIAASTAHPSGRQRQDTTADRNATDECPRFLLLKTPEYAGDGSDRTRNMLAFGWRAVISRAVRLLEKPDVIIGSSPHPAAALAAALLARRYKVPYVFEARDLWPQALIDMGRVGACGPTALLMRLLEKRLFEGARRSIALWPNAAAYLREHRIAAPEPAWIPNGINLAATAPPTPLPDTDMFTLMYLGGHGGANALDNLIRAMRFVQDRSEAENIRLRLIGDGPEKARLRALAASIGATNLTFEDRVPKSQVAEVAVEADAFVFNLLAAPVFRFGISPNKLNDYMAAQRPIIFCCSAFNNPVAEAGCGISVPPGNPEQLADAIVRLAMTPRARDARKWRSPADAMWSGITVSSSSHEFGPACATSAFARIEAPRREAPLPCPLSVARPDGNAPRCMPASTTLDGEALLIHQSGTNHIGRVTVKRNDLMQ